MQAFQKLRVLQNSSAQIQPGSQAEGEAPPALGRYSKGPWKRRGLRRILEDGRRRPASPPHLHQLGSLSPASLPKAWALLPASFRYISFNTPKEPAAPPFLLPGFTLLPPLYQGGGSLSVPVSPPWAFLRCPLQAQQESPTPPLGAPRVSQPVPGNCPVSLEPPVLFGCPTRPRQHPEITPPPHVQLCISPAWPRVHSLWASLATGHLIHLPLGQTSAWSGPYLH